MSAYKRRTDSYRSYTHDAGFLDNKAWPCYSSIKTDIVLIKPKEDVRKSSEDYAIMLEWFDCVGYNADVPALAKKYDIRLTSLAEWAGQLDWKAKKAA